MRLSLLFFTILCICISVDGYKFLLYSPKVGRSRIGFFGKLADILVDAGHDVTVYQPTLESILANLTIGTKKAKTIDRPADFEVLFESESEELQGEVWDVNAGKLGLFSNQNRMNSLFDTFANLCRAQLKDQKLIQRLKDEKFDVAFGDMFDSCFYGLVEKAGIKTTISVFATPVYDQVYSALGVPATPSFAPNMMIADPPPMSYVNRAKNLGLFVLMHLMAGNFFESITNAVKENLRVEHFDMLQKAADSAFIFTNAEEFTDFPRPTSHKVVHIGGFGLGKAKPLEPKYEQIFQFAKKGVIFLSFGSVAQSYLMPPEMKKMILDTFSKFPEINFIWKYEKDEHNIAEGHKNVFTFKWLPQMDLLEHPKLLAFISHGGMNSVTEGSSRGVPMICIPLFAEQSRNANMLKYRGTAVIVEKADLVAGHGLENAIKEILNNDKYNKNAKRLSRMIRSKPLSPEERIIKYSEFAAEFGANNNLEMTGRHLNFIEFYCLDIIMPFFLVAIILLVLVVKMLKFFVRKIMSLFIGNKKKVE